MQDEFDDIRHPWLQWGDWLSAMGWAAVKPKAVLHFNQYDQVIQAALDGQGVALGRIELIQPLVDAGRLVVLAAPRNRADNGHAYWLIRANERARDEVRRVADWIETEAASSRSAVDA